MYICFQNESALSLAMTKKMKIHRYKGSLNTIMKLLEENGKMYGYEITQKVKAITRRTQYYRGRFVSCPTN
jgi:hypothetical protein